MFIGIVMLQSRYTLLSVLLVFQACLKVSESEWSDRFSMDTVGSAGTVTCKIKGFHFEVIVIFVLI